MRFAVKEDFPIQLPPSLVGTLSRVEWRDEEQSNGGGPYLDELIDEAVREEAWLEYEERYASVEQRMRFKWDDAVNGIRDAYLELIDMGMPAEDARGLAPHNIVTKINWVVDLRALMATAGQRLCTQAQWEHREMWDSLIRSIREYGRTQTYSHKLTGEDVGEGGQDFDAKPGDIVVDSSSWQFEFLANRFKPVCYQTGRCQFRSDFDRFCNIRDRVELNAAHGRPSSEWDTTNVELGIPEIHPQEWLDPNAAISPTADWRSEEALNNIKNRR